MKLFLVNRPLSHYSAMTKLFGYLRDNINYDAVLSVGSRFKPPEAGIVHLVEPLEMTGVRKHPKAKIAVTVHDLAPINQANSKDVTDPWIKRTIYRKMYRRRVDSCIEHANIFIANSSQTRDELIDYSPKSENKIRVVNLGIEDKFKCIRTPNKDRVRVIGTLERWQKDKLRRIADFSKWHLTLDCDEFIPENKLVDFYNGLDCYINPQTYEGFGMTIIEAVSCGRPVILFETAKMPKEVKSLTNIAKDERDAADMIQSGELRTFQNPFTLQKMIAGIQSVYKELFEA